MARCWFARAMIGAAAVLLALPAAALAQSAVDPIDTCIGVDHNPVRPIGGSPSLAHIGASFNPNQLWGDYFLVDPANSLFVDVAGASGNVSGSAAAYQVAPLQARLYQPPSSIGVSKRIS